MFTLCDYVFSYTYFQNYATCVVCTWKVFLVFWLPSIKLRTICFNSRKLKMIWKFQPFEYYRKKDKFASFQILQSKDFAGASRFHIWLTAAKTQKTRRVVNSAGRVILKIGVSVQINRIELNWIFWKHYKVCYLSLSL